MIFKNKILSIITLVLFLYGCNEDTITPIAHGNIQGQVLNAIDLTPIADAKVTTTPTTTTLLTDSLGQFLLENIPVSTYSVRVEKTDFAIKVEGVTVTRDNTSDITIQLSEDTNNNTAPLPPSIISPADAATNQSVNLRLEWSATDDDEDELEYEVLVYEGQQSTPIFSASGIKDSFVDLSDLKYSTTYFWQVIVSDGSADPVYGMTWRFTTQDFPDHRYLFARELDGIYHIFSADGEGEEIQLTDGPASSWRPVINPTRDKIAFISNAGIENHIYTMNRDGSNRQKITTFPVAGGSNQELDFSWSPDGGKILYTQNTYLRTVNADGSGQSVLFDAPAGYTFVESQWSPDGNQILVRTQGILPYTSQIWLLSGTGNFESTLVPDEPGSTGGAVFYIDGSKILYSRDMSGFESATGRQLNSRIFVMNINNGAIADLSVDKINGTNDFDARYTSNGAQIIFTNRANDDLTAPNIYLMDTDGENRTMLFENAEMGVQF